jgi:hypothetical protein
VRLYFAGVEGQMRLFKTNPFYYEQKNYLTTFAYFAKAKNIDKRIENFFRDYPTTSNMLLDSGAFSVYTGKLNITVQEYAEFLKKHGHRFCDYINLDKLVGNGTSPAESLKTTLHNLDFLEKQGLKPVPVYQHMWFEKTVLEEFLDKYDYIFIGGMASDGVDKTMLFNYLDFVFSTNSKYKKKLHGLGQTSSEVLFEYPWYSVDSTSWLHGAISNRLFYLKDSLEVRSIKLEKNSYIGKLFPAFCYDSPNDSKSLYLERTKFNVRFFHKYEGIVTDVWKERGVEWKD